MPAILAAIFAGCGDNSLPSLEPEMDRPNLVIISLDTLRADRVGAYGYDRPTTPALDALAASSVQFQNVVAESPWTLPSHTTIFSGRYPSSHGVVEELSQIPADLPLLAEQLTENGYRSYAYTDGGFVPRRAPQDI